MKRVLLLFPVLLMFFCGSTQPRADAAVTNAVSRLRSAMLDADSTVLAALTHPALSYAHSSGKVETKTEFVQALASGRSDFVQMELTGQTVQRVRRTAIVRHLLTGKIVDNGKESDVRLHVLQVWIKNGGKWVLLARQAARAT